ncbi:MAG: L-lactate permease [Chloroflexi bacterium]|nr:L-lactate permease [Chloroflexota bacterium]
MTIEPAAKALLAALPILIILLLMLAARWSAVRAGAVGLLTAIVLAWGVFGYGQSDYNNIAPAAAAGGVLAEAAFTAGAILWIIFPALCIHQLQTRTGAIDVLRASLERVSPDPRLTVILVAWFFALFIEGAAGFGTTVALAAPLLVSIGFGAVTAVTMALIGHALGASFGAVGTPILPQIAATGLSGLELSRATGLYHSLLGWFLLFIVVMIAAKALKKKGREPVQPIWGWTLLAAALFLLSFFAISRWVGPELPTLGGALLGGLLFVAALRLAQKWRGGADRSAAAGQPGISGRDLLRAASPYLILVGLILFTRLIFPVRQALTGVMWQWVWLDSFRGSIQLLYHPGTMLFLAFLLGAFWQRAKLSDVKAAMTETAVQLGPVAVALLVMLALSRLMVHAGMIDTLAVAAAGVAGQTWPLVAPWVGMLGTFVTGSATASNVLFTDLQQATARNLGLPVLTIVGAQGFGAAVGNMIAPHNIIAGGATVGLSGQEGLIMRRTMGVGLIYAALGGLIALYLAAG